MDGMASFIGLDGLSEKNILTQEDTESTTKDVQSKK